MKMKYLAAAVAVLFAGAIQAQTTLVSTPNGYMVPQSMGQNAGANPNCTTSCNNSDQTMGDTSQMASADNDQSVTNQAGNHANSIASGVEINPSIQQSGNTVSQDGNSVQGGNATGGRADASGNQSSNDNKSSANTGASTSGASNGNMSGFGGTFRKASKHGSRYPR